MPVYEHKSHSTRKRVPTRLIATREALSATRIDILSLMETLNSTTMLVFRQASRTLHHSELLSPESLVMRDMHRR
jgi:hypothetical protein